MSRVLQAYWITPSWSTTNTARSGESLADVVLEVDAVCLGDVVAGIGEEGMCRSYSSAKAAWL